MRQLQFGIPLVELERVTFATIRFKRNLLIERARRIRLVTARAFQFAAVPRLNRFAKMQPVVELERVRIFQLLRVNLEFGMIHCE